MPICNKPPEAVGNSKNAGQFDDHASEAAKVKRTREQAYFNSYDFDAIEVLPYDDDATVASVGASTDKEHGGSSKARLCKPPTTNMTMGKYRRNPAALARSPKSRRHPQLASSLSSKSGSSHSSMSERSSSSSSCDTKSGYLQRLGTFFAAAGARVTTQRSLPEAQCSRTSSESAATLDEVIIGMRNGDTVLRDEAGTGGFLLPRAMLKYQSVGISNPSANSMPLAVISTMHTTSPGKLLPNDNRHTAANSANNSLVNQPSSISKAKVSTTSTSTSNSNSNSNSNVHMMTLRSSNNARLGGNSNGIHGNTGFLMASEKASATKTTMPPPPTTLARIKKSSLSSTTTTTPSMASVERDSGTPDSDSNAGVAGNVGCRSAILVKTKPAAPQTASSSTTTTKSAQRGRAHSHQSHYSTDKSGSSGYYSSNVCSTYSMEEHIYCEPAVDILELNSNSKSVIGGTLVSKTPAINNAAANGAVVVASAEKLTSRLQQQPSAKVQAALVRNVEQNDVQSNSRKRDMNGVGQSKVYGGCEEETAEDDDDDTDTVVARKTRIGLTSNHRANRAQGEQKLNDNLRILETSIENLDRHLKNFPSLSTHERINSFVQAYHAHLPQHVDTSEKSRPLPTIMEGYDGTTQQPRSWQDDIADDSLMDIDLDAFLLANEATRAKFSKSTKAPKSTRGIDNPSFLNDEQEENNYKCAKYINSCPEDAYHVESDIVAGTSTASQKSGSVDHFLKRYEDQLHFQNTRELLEDVRDKIRLLSHASSDVSIGRTASEKEQEMPKELEGMITTLKQELESYLDRMNRHSELEIRQLCSGLVKNHNVIKMKKAFERRRSTVSLNAHDSELDFPGYEAIRDGLLAQNAAVPISIREQIASIRCASDPNFKMKRKSLAEVFPVADCYVETINEHPRSASYGGQESARVAHKTQLQRNLSFHKPVLTQLDSKAGASRLGASASDDLSRSGSGSGGDSGKTDEKDSILEWHRKKPSIWEQYYGTNRMNQSLLGKRNGMVVNSNQATMSYPSSRPESDFTLDLPRAEQLRIKMEKEKKFRQRCRYITTFLSLIFFLLTVMVVSLVLTRGKRMFGSMI